MKRRDVLALASLAGIAGTVGSCSRSPGGGPLTYTNRLRIPPLAQPRIAAGGVREFALALQAGGRSEFLPGKTTPTWGVNGPYLGPTVRTTRGDRVRMLVTNQVGESTSLHWHGMRLPARMDGGPHQPIAPGATWSPEWTVDQPAATLWYHPHPHGTTARHVYRGLAGLFLIDDPRGTALPSRYGIDDLPLIIQDRNSATAASWRMSTAARSGLSATGS
jgi:FtsP/CotA-like multicopper oxidase with cupredoxin domain